MVSMGTRVLALYGNSESGLCCVPRRDREDREREAREAEEREALKNMTDAERRAWEAAHPKVCPGISADHALCMAHTTAGDSLAN